jgi:hypothetical protein
LVFAWESANVFVLKKYVDADGVKHYEIYGPLFFASTTAFAEKFDVLNDPEEVVIDFRKQNCRYECHRCRSQTYRTILRRVKRFICVPNCFVDGYRHKYGTVAAIKKKDDIFSVLFL